MIIILNLFVFFCIYCFFSLDEEFLLAVLVFSFFSLFGYLLFDYFVFLNKEKQKETFRSLLKQKVILLKLLEEMEKNYVEQKHYIFELAMFQNKLLNFLPLILNSIHYNSLLLKFEEYTSNALQLIVEIINSQNNKDFSEVTDELVDNTNTRKKRRQDEDDDEDDDEEDEKKKKKYEEEEEYEEDEDWDEYEEDEDWDEYEEEEYEEDWLDEDDDDEEEKREEKIDEENKNDKPKEEKREEKIDEENKNDKPKEA